MTAPESRHVTIAPSLLAADFGRLREEVSAVEAAGADWLHLDVMDGHFVPNISFGPTVLAALRKHTKLPFDVHLMIAPVDRYLDAFIDAGADHILLHPEAGPHLHRSLQHIRAAGKKAGVVLNPATAPEAIVWALDLIDIVLVMSVNPGFGGQPFIPRSEAKVREVRALLDRLGSPAEIEIDGGIDQTNVASIVTAGARVIVAGSAIFHTPDPERATRALKAAALEAASSPAAR
jgi:ribulose-phosphate 3-epimerase